MKTLENSRYEIIRVRTWYEGRARVTSERTVRNNATYAEVIEMVSKGKSADMDEFIEELEEYGIACTGGYMVQQY